MNIIPFARKPWPILVLLIIGFYSTSAKGKYGGGTGEPNDPYLIFDANQMNAIGADPCDWDKHFKLMADIDLNTPPPPPPPPPPPLLTTDMDWSDYAGASIIVGTSSNPFTGVFDGNNHTISNFTLSDPGTNYAGLFGYISGGEIKNLGLLTVDVNASENNYIGALVGRSIGGTITDCYMIGNIKGRDYVGGLVGYNSGTIADCCSTVSVESRNYSGGLVGYQSGGAITNCCSTSSIESGNYAGGLAGYQSGSTIADCCSTGNIESGSYVGGLVGSQGGGTITNCCSTGSVDGINYVGGLVGSNTGSIANCYSTRTVTGNDRVGGLVGYGGIINDCYSEGGIVTGNNYVGGLLGHSGSIVNSYAANLIVGNTNVGGLVGYSGNALNSFWDIEVSDVNTSSAGIGKTTAEMQNADTFETWGSCGVIWTIDDGDYPRLAWQNLPGSPLGSEAVYGGGSGALWDPYLVYTAEHLNAIGVNPCHRNSHFKLMADIDLTVFAGQEFNIIGFDGSHDFTGIFDGNGHTISNFTYLSPDESDVGLFGYVSGEIKNLGLINAQVNAGSGSYVGTLVSQMVGTVSNCYSTGSVIGGMCVGGLLGTGWYSGKVVNCYSTADVNGFLYVGGLVGSYGIVVNCYSTGYLSGDWVSSVNGLVGNAMTVVNSFWDIETSGQDSLSGGKGKTTEQMQDPNTFFAWGLCSNEGIWTIDTGDYPRLAWENHPGDPIIASEPEYGGGDGTLFDPYLIFTAEQLNTIGLATCHWDKNFKLMGDIDLGDYTGTEYNIIGAYSNMPFTGIFDGNGHTISNFTWTSADVGHIGLFGYFGGEVRNLGLIDPNIIAGIGSYYVGPLTSRGSDGGKIINCYVDNGFVAGGGYIGGLCGSNIGTISNCNASGYVTGGSYFGGLCGISYSGTIDGCYATASVTGGYNSGYFGGLCGQNNSTIINCYSVCNIAAGDGSQRIGGLCGFNNYGTISNCDASCYVSAGVDSERIGGLCGYNNRGAFNNCYATGSVIVGDRASRVGGLFGYNNRGPLSSCYSSSSVVCGIESDKLGGLCGYNIYTTLNYCYATGSVTGGDRSVEIGGLCGYKIGSTINNCYAAGSVRGGVESDKVGGLFGDGTNSPINNCYSVGSVTAGTGSTEVGGLCGSNSGPTYNCFWNVETSGQTTSNGGEGKTTTEMMQQATFTNWDFVDVWTICEGTNYPRFFWQIPAADFLCPDGVDFIDYSFFTSHWQENNCAASNDCEGTDLDKLGTVDANDFAIFIDSWLMGVEQTSPPGQASNPNPPDGAIDVNFTADLSWTAGAGATSHDVYFGTSSPGTFQGNQTETTFDPGTMASGITFYWRIDTVNDKWGTTIGSVWSFTTIDLRASNPNPTNGALGVSTTADLTWTAGAGAISHDVYFGTSNPPPFIGNQSLTTFDPGEMIYGTTYYWRIDEVRADDTITGTVWSFTTMTSPPPF